MLNYFHNVSIKIKLLLAMGGALILSAATITVLNNSLSTDVVTKRLNQNELPFVISSIRLNIEKHIVSAINASMQIAENQFIVDWLKQNEPQGQRPQLQQYLQRLNKVNKAGETFVGSSVSGNYYTQNGYLKTMSRSNNDDGWFYAFFADNKPYDTGIGPNKDTGELTLFINYRVVDQGQTLGVAGMGVGMQELVDFINGFKLGATGYVFVVSKDGAIKIHNNKALLSNGTIANIPEVAKAASTLTAGKQFTYAETEYNGAGFVVASDYLPALDWYVVTVVPKDEVYGALTSIMRNSIVVTLVVTLIFLFVSVALAKTISAPIVNIAGLLRNIAAGDADLRQRLPVTSNDELGVLAANFNTFIEQLQHLIQQILNNCRVLLVSVDEVNQLSSNTSSELTVQRDQAMQVATAVTQMGSTIEDIARSANETANAAEDAAAKVDEGTKVVDSTITYIEQLSADMGRSGEVINELAVHSESIGSILNVIRGISE